MQTAIVNCRMPCADSSPNTVTLEQARSWIGRRLILQKPLAGFKPGITCIVMCVVDFGEGPLLWISSNDNRARDVDQIEIHRVPDYFQVISPEQPAFS